MIKTSYFWKALHEPNTSETYVSISRQKMKGAETMGEYTAQLTCTDMYS